MKELNINGYKEMIIEKVSKQELIKRLDHGHRRTRNRNQNRKTGSNQSMDPTRTTPVDLGKP